MSNTIDIALPEEQREGTKVTLQRWLVSVGDHVRATEPLAELETDKVSMDLYAPYTGVIHEILVTPGCDIEPNMVLCRLIGKNSYSISGIHEEQIRISPEERVTLSSNVDEVVSCIDDPIDSRRHLIGPAVRSLLKEHAIDIDHVSGTGLNGRVTRNDVIAFLESSILQKETPVSNKLSVEDGVPVVGEPSLQGRMLPHTSIRKSIAKHMSDSLLHTSPHVTSVFEMDMSNIIEHLNLQKEEFSENYVKLTFTAYFLAACVRAIRSVPEINSRFHEDALEVFDNINIGVATALPSGEVIVPVVKNIQEKYLFDIAKDLQKQTSDARNGKLKPIDIKNGTFTISNHGVSGSLFAAPIIINQPQVAILGIGKLEKRVVVIDDEGRDIMAIKPMCYVSLSIDHRAVDAVKTNNFLRVFVETIEHWDASVSTGLPEMSSDVC